MSAPGPGHARLAPFVGTWRTEGRVLPTADTPPAEIIGTDSYEWLAGGFFLVHRVDVRMGGEPVEAIEIIGWDAESGTYSMRSYDNHGNEELMRMTERDGTWTVQGESARFTGAFSDGGGVLSGHWERREVDRWLPWMDVRLTRADAG